MMDHDMELLREYAARHPERAFAVLIARHIGPRLFVGVASGA
jgi:hypothetical protein